MLGIIAIILGCVLLFTAYLGAGKTAAFIGIALFVAGTYLISKTTNLNSTVKSKGKPVCSFSCTGLSGLPLGQVTYTALGFNDAIIFQKDNNTFELPYNKIVSAELTEKSKLVGASTGSAVAGAIMFGAIGAIIASRPNNVKEYYMVITYVSNGKSNTLVVAVPTANWSAATKAINRIKKNITTSQNVVL